MKVCSANYFPVHSLIDTKWREVYTHLNREYLWIRRSWFYVPHSPWNKEVALYYQTVLTEFSHILYAPNFIQVHLAGGSGSSNLTICWGSHYSSSLAIPHPSNWEQIAKKILCCRINGGFSNCIGRCIPHSMNKFRQSFLIFCTKGLLQRKKEKKRKGKDVISQLLVYAPWAEGGSINNVGMDW